MLGAKTFDPIRDISKSNHRADGAVSISSGTRHILDRHVRPIFASEDGVGYLSRLSTRQHGLDRTRLR